MTSREYDLQDDFLADGVVLWSKATCSEGQPWLVKRSIAEEPSMIISVESKLYTEADLISRYPNVHINVLSDALVANGRTALVYEPCAYSLPELQRLHWGNGSTTGFPQLEIKRLMYQLLSAVAHLHQHSISHQGLRPHCIMLQENGLLKVSGLDSARVIPKGRVDAVDAVINIYTPPEVIVRDSNGLPSDVWAIGCICAELILGFTLFTGDTDSDLMYSIGKVCGLSPRHVSIIQERPEYSRLMARIASCSSDNFKKKFAKVDRNTYQFLERCLKTDPNKRATAQDLLKLDFFQEVTDAVGPSSMRDIVALEYERMKAVHGNAMQDRLVAVVASLAASLSAAGISVFNPVPVPAPAPARTALQRNNTLSRSLVDLGLRGSADGAVHVSHFSGGVAREAMHSMQGFQAQPAAGPARVLGGPVGAGGSALQQQWTALTPQSTRLVSGPAAQAVSMVPNNRISSKPGVDAFTHAPPQPSTNRISSKAAADPPLAPRQLLHRISSMKAGAEVRRSQAVVLEAVVASELDKDFSPAALGRVSSWLNTADNPRAPGPPTSPFAKEAHTHTPLPAHLEEVPALLPRRLTLDVGATIAGAAQASFNRCTSMPFHRNDQDVSAPRGVPLLAPLPMLGKLTAYHTLCPPTVPEEEAAEPRHAAASNGGVRSSLNGGVRSSLNLTPAVARYLAKSVSMPVTRRSEEVPRSLPGHYHGMDSPMPRSSVNALFRSAAQSPPGVMAQSLALGQALALAEARKLTLKYVPTPVTKSFSPAVLDNLSTTHGSAGVRASLHDRGDRASALRVTKLS